MIVMDLDGTDSLTFSGLEILRILLGRGACTVGEGGEGVHRAQAKMQPGRIGRDGINVMPKAPRNQDSFQIVLLLD